MSKSFETVAVFIPKHKLNDLLKINGNVWFKCFHFSYGISTILILASLLDISTR